MNNKPLTYTKYDFSIIVEKLNWLNCARTNSIDPSSEIRFWIFPKKRTLSFEEGFLYSAFHTFISRLLNKNKITQLPEKMFSGLTSLQYL